MADYDKTLVCKNLRLKSRMETIGHLYETIYIFLFVCLVFKNPYVKLNMLKWLKCHDVLYVCSVVICAVLNLKSVDLCYPKWKQLKWWMGIFKCMLFQSNWYCFDMLKWYNLATGMQNTYKLNLITHSSSVRIMVDPEPILGTTVSMGHTDPCG